MRFCVSVTSQRSCGSRRALCLTAEVKLVHSGVFYLRDRVHLGELCVRLPVYVHLACGC